MHTNVNNIEVKGKVVGWGDGQSGMVLMSGCPTSHVNSNVYDIVVKVGGGEDGMSRMASALAGITSHSNCDNNEFNDKVRKGGGWPVWDAVGIGRAQVTLQWRQQCIPGQSRGRG